ncbi:MAG: glycosyltransferase family 2 protein [Pseudomonadota bacterium]
MPRLPLSVFIIARDEAERLPATLAAVRDWAGEIVVVDSGSTDATVKIAEQADARVFSRDWPGYGPQKRFGEEQCRHDWLLNLDADEVVTPALAAEIAALFAGDPPPALFRIRILNVYPGDRRPRPFANDYNVVRLYHRAAGRYRDDPLFDRVVPVPGAAERQLRAPIWHYPFLSFAGLVAKQDSFTSFQAEASGPRSPWLLRLRLLTEGPLTFLRFYLLRGHILGGWKGLAFAALAARARTLRIIKLLDRQAR